MCLPVKPYKIEKEWEHAGLKCVVVQAREGMHRCGYVRVPPTHSQFGKEYDDVPVDVHGGLTFAAEEPCEHEDGKGFWFGFDCAHYGDAMCDRDSQSELSEMKFINQGHFWTMEEVAAECNQLAEQLSVL
jgi:hypothetical protein